MTKEFSYTSYRELLRAFKGAGYEFVDFPSFALSESDSRSRVLLRHDIDFDLEAAAKMAEIEFEEEVQSTYFFLLRTKFYNLFLRDSGVLLDRIRGYGHRIGLHFDRGEYPESMTRQELAGECRREARVLSEIVGEDVNVVSYHRPDEDEKTGKPETSFPLLNTYMAAFTKDILYRSDSRGCWRYGHPLESEAFQNRLPMQILIHPIWWRSAPLEPLEVLHELIEKRKVEVETEVARNCTIYRR